jgi:hypothetical protein
LESRILRPEHDLAKYPLIPVKIANQDIYIVCKPMGGTLLASFSEYFIKFGGKTTDDYGTGFDVFLRDQIYSKSELMVHPREVEVERDKYLNDKNKKYWVKLDKLHTKEKTSFKIDALEWDMDRVFVISCKARNFAEDARALSEFGYVSYRMIANAEQEIIDELIEVIGENGLHSPIDFED